MHSSVVRATAYTASIFALTMAGVMLVPALVDLYYAHDDWQVFAICSGVTAAVSLTVAAATKDRANPINSTRLAFFVVIVLWVTLSAIGMLPFYAASLSLNLADAFFESVSAVTTTGATVIRGLDALPPGLLLWRSLLQWIGGLGVIALGLFFLPFLNVGGFSYFRIESTDIEERPFDRLASFVRALIAIYAILTALCTLAYAAVGLQPFDAINHAMTTVSTGGLSTHDASFGYFQGSGALWVAMVFMILGALPFSILILFVVRGRLDALRDPEIRLFLAYTVTFILLVTLHRTLMDEALISEAFTSTAFNFVSIITTTGFVSEDYSSWGPFAVMSIFLATFLGGCSGSTSGGVKAYRILILARMLRNGLGQLVYGHSVQPLRYGNRIVDEEMQRSIILFAIAFMIIWLGGSLALAAGNLDMITSLTAALSALCNVGPGLGNLVGPAGTFSPLSDYAKWILAAIMLCGRLEILAVLVVLTPTFWRS